LGKKCTLHFSPQTELISFIRKPQVVAEKTMEKDMQETTAPNRRFRTLDAARYVGLSKSTLEKYRVTGGGPVYASLGRIVVYESSDLDQWFNQRKRASTSEALRDHG
jgi:predicted DNA-binding transcriptional regulator AlpA